MNRVSKIVYTLLLLFCFSILDSCTYVKKADSALRKTFGTANRFKRQKALYTRRLGLNNKKGADNPTGEDQMQRNPIQQKNKVKQIDWLGNESSIDFFYANEIKPKPSIDIFELKIKNNLVEILILISTLLLLFYSPSS